MDVTLDKKAPRMWLKAFWGFGPEEDGYLGFTKEGDRESFIQEAQPGDLVLIYGSTSEHTAEDDRKQVLGILEIDLTPIKDIDRMSELARDAKDAEGLSNRWTFAVPVRRAWRIMRRIEVKNIAPITYRHERARRIASRGELLTENEAKAVLQLPVQQANVFGEPTIVTIVKTEELGSFFEPSKGINPSFGKRTSNYVDGEHYLYMLVARGNIAALLDCTEKEIADKCLIKIGFSNNPSQRCRDHNSTIPEAAIFKWHLDQQSKPFPDGQSAKDAEDALKELLKECSKSQGGEFFLGDKKVMDNAFGTVPGVGFRIVGAYRKD